MLVNTAVAQRRVDRVAGKLAARVLVSFPDPKFPDERFNSLIVAPSMIDGLLSFAVERLDKEATFFGRQTAIDVEQAKYLIDVLQTWVRDTESRVEKPRRRCGDTSPLRNGK